MRPLTWLVVALGVTAGACSDLVPSLDPPARWQDRVLLRRGAELVRLHSRVSCSFPPKAIDEWEVQLSRDGGGTWWRVLGGENEHVDDPAFAYAGVLPDGHVAVAAGDELAFFDAQDRLIHASESQARGARWRPVLRWISQQLDPFGRNCKAALALAEMGEEVPMDIPGEYCGS